MNSTSHQIQKNLVKIAVLVVFTLVTGIAQAQSDREARDRMLYEKIQRLTDSIENLNPGQSPVYMGFEITVGVAQFNLESNIEQLDGLSATFLGSRAGGVIGNHRGKLKATFGLYYSDDATPYTIDIKRTTLSANIYILRTGKNVKYHAIEPYVAFGACAQALEFYGSYLGTAQKRHGGEEPLLGKTRSAHALFGGGFEFQLETDTKKFLHFFAEVTVRPTLANGASNSTFSNTGTSTPVLFTFGVNFGAFRN